MQPLHLGTFTASPGEPKKQRGSQVVIDLIVRAALRNGWRPPPREGEAPTGG